MFAAERLRIAELFCENRERVEALRAIVWTGNGAWCLRDAILWDYVSPLAC